MKKGEIAFTEDGVITSVQTKYSYQVDWDKHYEPDGPSAFLNHSCLPNIGMRVKKGAKPVFYALRDIAEGEELFIDYATFEYKTKVLANIKCLCGAPNCRGHITGFVGLSPEQVKDYSDCLADYLKEKKPAK